MFNQLRAGLLQVLRVPPEPESPFGDPASTRVFRASPKYYSLRLLGWALGQLFALTGLIFGVVIMLTIENQAAEIRSRPAVVTASSVQAESSSVEAKPKPVRLAKAKHGFKDVVNDLATTLAKVPPGRFAVIWLLKLLGLLFYLTQLVLSYVALRLDYEMRWYVVTDRSLRIRTGLWQVQELTMSFANLQQVELSRGPIQQLLGLADVRVQSAGGSSGGSHHASGQSASLHTGFFHGVDNAAEVRDLILSRLRHFRETGLGDLDEVHQAAPMLTVAPNAAVAPESAAVSAACELLAETRQLRAVLLKGQAPS
jgi:membrane protein YdbS with pleckstrin-like domain